jgi:endo-1,4-beta-mannosidase
VPRPFAHLQREGEPVTWLGANFWSRRGGPLMWRWYDHDLVRSELEALRRHGLTTTRSFLYWPDVMPEPDRLDDQQVRRFDDFLALHEQLGMATVPTFVVGHMSGQNWDPAWRQGRDLYADTWMVARQAWYVRTLVRRWHDHPAVAGWLLTNEMPIYGGPAPTSVVTAWAELLVQAVRAGGGTQPVSVGDGAWGVEVTGEHNGFSVRQLGRVVDFVGPHVYRMESDVVRQHLKCALRCELAAVAGRPVVLEEFGLSSDFASEENAAHYYRQQLHLSLLGGATGWIAWNNTDLDPLVAQDPYRHHPFELHFGLTTSDGSPKASLLEMRAFRRVLDAVEVTRCRREPTRTALVVSSYLEGDVPFTEPLDRQLVVGAVEQAYVAAREAGVPPALVREADGVDEGYRLYLVPSTKQLTGPSWLRLGELAEAGAVVYVSYCAGEGDVQRGPWWTATEHLFGVRNRLVYGLTERIEDDVVEMTFVRRLGTLHEGQVLRFDSAGGPEARSYLPVEVTNGEVLARDGHGRPAIVAKRHGDGLMVLCAYPIEHMARCQGRVNPEDTWRLYAALAAVAGAAPVLAVNDPRVLVDGLVHEDGRRFVWFVSECAEPLEVRPEVPTGVALLPVAVPHDGRSPRAPVGDVVRLPPYGVQVLELVSSEESDG